MTFGKKITVRQLAYEQRIASAHLAHSKLELSQSASQ